jgi:hypothetical protein
MANSLYAKAKEKFLTASLSWTAHDIKVVLVDTNDYTVNLTTHEFLSDIAAGARVATSANLGSKTVTNGVADAADASFSNVTGDQFEAVVIYRDTGVAATSPLIAYMDTATGFPATPLGGNITLTWNASGIFTFQSIYNKAKEKFLTAALNWSSHDIKAVLVDAGDYTVDLVNHEFLSSITAGARVATSANLGSKTVTNGVADAGNVTLSAVTGDQSEAVVIYRDTGDAATSPLIAYLNSGTGLPVTPDSGNIEIQGDSDGIFAL